MLKSFKPLVLAAALALMASPALSQGKTYGVGVEPSPAQIAGWAHSVRPDGQGLPKGKGTAKIGEPLFVEKCAACHGEFGESAGRWPILAGGDLKSLKGDDPVKSVGSYWPYASTLIDYIQAAMPFGNARSLEGDELYAITAYILYLNDIIAQDFELSDKNFATIKLPNQANFKDDDRETAEKHFWNPKPCMEKCFAEPAKITGRAAAIDVTPDSGKGPKVE